MQNVKPYGIGYADGRSAVDDALRDRDADDDRTPGQVTEGLANRPGEEMASEGAMTPARCHRCGSAAIVDDNGTCVTVTCGDACQEGKCSWGATEREAVTAWNAEQSEAAKAHLVPCGDCEGRGRVTLYWRSRDGGTHERPETGSCDTCDGSGDVCKYCSSWSCPGDCRPSLDGDCDCALADRT